jgi:hypothetical protein
MNTVGLPVPMENQTLFCNLSQIKGKRETQGKNKRNASQ